MLKQLLELRNRNLPLNEALVLVWVHENPGTTQASWCSEFRMGTTVASLIARKLINKGLIREVKTDEKVIKSYNATGKGQTIALTLGSGATNMPGDVNAFHRKFKLAYDGPPRFLSDELHKLSAHCLKEEVQEYEDAIAAGNMIDAHDALIDLVYFALGRADLHGFPFSSGWKRVQEANMAKVRAERKDQSARGDAASTYDVVKPEGWTPPDHSPDFQ